MTHLLKRFNDANDRIDEQFKILELKKKIWNHLQETELHGYDLEIIAMAKNLPRLPEELWEWERFYLTVVYETPKEYEDYYCYQWMAG